MPMTRHAPHPKPHGPSPPRVATLLRLKEWRDKVEADNTPRSEVIGTDGVAILGLLLLAALTAIALAGAFWSAT
ncbi:hypothetical protein [Pacificispira sp.]|uniref:hypothetical protein n=1 Tax=Pacificispira sp. TaxID=2888761 RepID=UPI003B526A91